MHNDAVLCTEQALHHEVLSHLEFELRHAEESRHLAAAYRFGHLGSDGVTTLVRCLRDPGTSSMHGKAGASVTIRRTVVYGLIASGSLAVPHLREMFIELRASLQCTSGVQTPSDVAFGSAPSAESIGDTVKEGAKP